MTKMLSNPKKLFLIDGIGALLSTFLLGIVLVRFDYLFGMPRKELYFLAVMPFFFAIYDFVCYWATPQNWRPFLAAIAIANLIYCCISIALVFYSYHKLTNLGLIYFLVEFIVIIILVGVELKIIYQKK